MVLFEAGEGSGIKIQETDHYGCSQLAVEWSREV